MPSAWNLGLATTLRSRRRRNGVDRTRRRASGDADARVADDLGRANAQLRDVRLAASERRPGGGGVRHGRGLGRAERVPRKVPENLAVSRLRASGGWSWTFPAAKQRERRPWWCSRCTRWSAPLSIRPDTRRYDSSLLGCAAPSDSVKRLRESARAKTSEIGSLGNRRSDRPVVALDSDAKFEIPRTDSPAHERGGD